MEPAVTTYTYTYRGVMPNFVKIEMRVSAFYLFLDV